MYAKPQWTRETWPCRFCGGMHDVVHIYFPSSLVNVDGRPLAEMRTQRLQAAVACAECTVSYWVHYNSLNPDRPVEISTHAVWPGMPDDHLLAYMDAGDNKQYEAVAGPVFPHVPDMLLNDPRTKDDKALQGVNLDNVVFFIPQASR